MRKYIITISREFGLGAREIAYDLSENLKLPLYDKELVDLAAEQAGVQVDIMKEADEVLKKGQGRLLTDFSYGSSTAFYSESAVNAQASVIRQVADKPESCILFGRCADYILKEYPNVINFFLYAPLEYRIKHIAQTYNLDVKESLKMIKRIDKQRHNYYKYVTSENRGDRSRKHVMIDVEVYGVNGTVELMKKAVQILVKE